MNPELAEDQRISLGLIYQPFRANGEWPEFAFVDKSLDRYGIPDAAEFLKTFPIGLMAPDPARPHFQPRQTDRLGLTVAGVAACDGSQPDLDLFLSALQLFLRLEATHDVPPVGGEALLAGSRDLQQALGYTEAETARTHALFEYELGILGSGGGDPKGEWSFQIPSSIRRFRDVETIDDYLALRITPPPFPGLPEIARTLGDLTEAFGNELGANPLLADQSQEPRLLRQALIHPVITSTVGTVIGGLILAWILSRH